jgi:hypothetical protein
MTINPTKLNDLPKEIAPQSILVWGGSGTGKTVLMGTAGDNSLFINNGRGGETLRSKWFQEKYKVNPTIIDIPSAVAKNDPSFAMVMEACEWGLQNPDIKCICIDDASAFTLSSMVQAMKYNQTEGKSKTLAAAEKFDVIVPAVQDFGTEMLHTKQFFDWLISECKFSGKHLIVGAHSRNIFKKAKTIGDQPELIKAVPYFTGADKNPDAIAGMFDWVFYSRATGGGDKIKYRITTEGDEELVAKTRHKGLLPVDWQDPNLQFLFGKLKG